MGNRIFPLVVAILSLVVVVILARAFLLVQRPLDLPECRSVDDDFISLTPEMTLRFQQALRHRTISWGENDTDTKELLRLQAFIKEAYPSIHSSPLVTMEVVAEFSLLYKVQGSDPSRMPYMLTNHLDVVPADADKWSWPPFDGEVKDGFFQGRGTIDDKHGVFGILEALEYLLKSGFQPKQTFYVAFGCDEEVGGYGAGAIGKLLGGRGVKVAWLLDEGPTILNGITPGVDVPVALVGTSEKGYLTLRLTVSTSTGHSSMPPPETSIGILAKAVARLEENPHINMFGSGPERATMEYLAPHMNVPLRIVMSNLWLFQPIVARILSLKQSTNALIRTTTAVTEFHAGIKDNVLAPSAWATVNHRIHPSQTAQQVIDYDRQVIADDRVQFEVLISNEPLPQSPHGNKVLGYQLISSSIRQIWSSQNVVVAPGLMIGATDTRRYTDLTDNIYRFSPTVMYPDDLARFHGINERISVKNYEQVINFYYHLMKNAEELSPTITKVHSHEL